MTTAVQRRRGTSTEHATFTGLDGEITVNTTTYTAHIHDGATVGGVPLAKADGSNIVTSSIDINGGTIDGTVIGGSTAAAITGTTITGTSFVSSGNMTFGDDDKAIFGAGSDLQIYHDGSNSYISDQGTGRLVLNSSGGSVRIEKSPTENMAIFSPDGNCELFYDNALKLATTATGIDVTGTVTADGLTVDKSGGNIAASFINSDSNNSYIQFQNSTTGTTTYTDGSLVGIDSDESLTIWQLESNHIKFGTSATERMRIDSSGDVKLITANDTAGTSKFLTFGTNSFNRAGIKCTNAATYDGSLEFYTGNSSTFEERMRIDSSGNLGLGMAPTTNNISKSISLVNGGSIFGYGSGTYITANSNYNGAWNAVATGADSRILLDGNVVFSRSASATAGSAGAVSESMRIDSSGNLGLGVVPSAWSQGRAFELLAPGMGLWNGSGSPSSIYMTSNAYFNGGFKYGGNGEASHYYQYLGQHVWSTATSGTAGNAISFTQAMTLDASGNLLVGTTSATGSGASSGKQVIQFNGAAENGIYFDDTRTAAGTSVAAIFGRGSTAVGRLDTTLTSVALTSLSDERVKNNIVDAPSASDDIDAIQVRSFDWKSDGSHQKYGMVAQELMTVAPEAVSVPEDPEQMMGVDYSKLVPMMLKEIQSLRARVAQLEGAN